MSSSGPNYPGSISTSAYSGGVDWTNASNIGADDNTYATVTLASKSSYYLKAQNFGFSIPAGASIDGITVEIGAYASAYNRVVYSDVILLDASGAQVGNDKGTGYVPASEGPTVFGGTADTWGASPTPSMVNDADFGVMLRVTVGALHAETVYVDHIRVTITYTVASYTAEGSLQVGAVSASGEGSIVNPVGFISWPLRWLGVVSAPNGEGILQVGPISISGAGTVTVPVSGEGTLLVGATSIFGTGIVGSPADGVLTLGDISFSGVGVVCNPITVEGTLTAGAVSVAGIGVVSVPISAEGTLSVAAVSVSGTGTVSIRFNITFYRKYKPTSFTVATRTTEFAVSGRNTTIYVPARIRTFTASART